MEGQEQAVKMLEPRIIKTDEQYRAFLAEVERLAEQDPDPQSPEGARLEVLAKLVEDYERSAFPFAKPDPVDAIQFRMEQQNLRQKDLAGLLGGKNRASEVLARKRPLTLPMIRALHEELDIPAHLLIRDTAPGSQEMPSTEADDRSYVDLIVRRGWSTSLAGARNLLKRLLSVQPGSPAFLKHTATFGRDKRTNLTHVWLWLARVRDRADSRPKSYRHYEPSCLNEELIRYVARLSWMTDGPRAAVRFLEEKGIEVVIEPHLPSTHLDGAAMLSRHGTPVIGLTLREDRLDNFWFTLVHELIHVWKHLDTNEYRAIVDERIEEREDSEGIEQEANRLAADFLIPRAQWKRSDAYLKPTAASIQEFARQLQISPAIVAGRIRHERRNYALFTPLVGHHQARIQFPDVSWS